MRYSGSVRRRDGDGTSPHYTLGPLTIREYARLRREGHADRDIVRSFDLPAATASGWLALHPRVAGAMELNLDEGSWLNWSLDGRPAARSLWWRSGYFYWSPYSDYDEVGEGWLVLGSPGFVAQLQDNGWGLAYQVRTVRRGTDGADEHEILAEGHRPLTSSLRSGSWPAGSTARPGDRSERFHGDRNQPAAGRA